VKRRRKKRSTLHALGGLIVSEGRGMQTIIENVQRDDSPDRRRYRLGMLTLVTELSVLATRFETWLPRVGDPGDEAPDIAIWMGCSEKRGRPTGGTSRVSRGVALWLDEQSDHAWLLSPAGHAELDLKERWGRVSPRDGASDLGTLLDASTSILMGRAGAVLMDASAIIDSTGGGWLIVGPREDRATLVRDLVRDGLDFVSDDQVVARRARHQEGLILLESWHRPAERACAGHPAPVLPVENWKPVAQLRGVLLARTISSRAPLPWRAVTREQTLESLVEASPHVDSDPAMADTLRELLASCAARPAFVALSATKHTFPSGNAVWQLARAIDAMS